ncbi:MAG: UbiA family prenyltransferase, partial [candidate division WOR-3 bacterium]
HFCYSSKPLRLKRFYPVSIFTLSLAALLTAISGYALFNSYKPFISFPLKPVLLIFVPLFLSLNFRDLADYRGDGRTNITTLFTIFGLEKGRRINACLVLLSYMLVPLILKFYPLFTAAIPLGIASFYFSIKKPFNEKMIFYIYFILIAVLGILLHTKTEIFLGSVLLLRVGIACCCTRNDFSSGLGNLSYKIHMFFSSSFGGAKIRETD